MRTFTQEELKSMTKERAMQLVEREVFQATQLFEKLEGAQVLMGNGHHMRQHVAKLAADYMDERFTQAEEIRSRK